MQTSLGIVMLHITIRELQSSPILTVIVPLRERVAKCSRRNVRTVQLGSRVIFLFRNAKSKV